MRIENLLCHVLLCAGCAIDEKSDFSSHKSVIAAFGEHFVKTGVFPKQMGRELNRAFEKRPLGDYEFTSVVSDEDAGELLAHGKEFCSAVKEWIDRLHV